MKEIIHEVRKWAKTHGVKVKFQRLKGAVAGHSCYQQGLIVINSELSSRAEILSTYAHEYCHIEAYRRGLWKEYHGGETDPEKLAQIGVKVERWVDREAQNLLYNYDRRVRYLGAYLDETTEELRKFLEKYYKDNQKDKK
jgi:hypothetical protein